MVKGHIALHEIGQVEGSKCVETAHVGKDKSDSKSTAQCRRVKCLTNVVSRTAVRTIIAFLLVDLCQC